MFGSKTKPAVTAVPPVVALYNASTLEKGNDSNTSSHYVCLGDQFEISDEV